MFCVCVCVSGGLLYVVFQELFSSSSPNKVYGKAFDKVKSNPEVRMRSLTAEAKQYQTSKLVITSLYAWIY